MHRSRGNVQKLDMEIPQGFASRMTGAIHRIKQTREIWGFVMWGLLKATRERVETTTEFTDEARHDRG
jgi:hypothetical protein